MDDMDLKFKGGWMSTVISKLVTKYLQKKLGYKININFNELDVNYENGETVIKTQVEIKLDKGQFKKIMKDMDIL
jgi:predicted phosphoadenosine phosphosulfate sulfurtransferase